MCPMGAIKERDTGTARKQAVIDQDECVECGVCLKSEICPVEAIYWPELTWPRAITRAFSAVRREESKPVTVPFEMGDKLKSYISSPGGGRGTSEMKTNDVTGRFKEGMVGIAAEMGRPQVGFTFRDLEKVSIAMRKLGVEFEPDNPVTDLLDTETGVILPQYEELKNERALSSIIEMLVPEEKAVEVLEGLMEAAKEIDCVMSIDIINKCKDGTIPVKSLLDEAGIKVRINGKTNIGLGRPLIP